MIIDAKQSHSLHYRAYSEIGAVASAIEKMSVGDAIYDFEVINAFGDKMAIEKIRMAINKSSALFNMKLSTKVNDGKLAVFRIK